MEIRNTKTKSMILCALFTALIAIGAFIRIPLPVTVFTFQFIFVLMAGLLLGPKLGSMSVILYILIGLAGFPVFTEGGGLQYVLKPTFGYLLAFILTAFLVGYMRERFGVGSFGKLFASCLAAMIITYLIGSFYTYMIFNGFLGTKIGYWACLIALFPVTALKDILSCAVASIAAQKLYRHVGL